MKKPKIIQNPSTRNVSRLGKGLDKIESSDISESGVENIL